MSERDGMPVVERSDLDDLSADQLRAKVKTAAVMYRSRVAEVERLRALAARMASALDATVPATRHALSKELDALDAGVQS